MLRLNHYHGYAHRRRYLTIRVDPEYPIDRSGWRTRGYEMRLYPHEADRRIAFHWSGHWQYKQPYVMRRAMGVMIEVQATPDHRERGWVPHVYTQHHITHHDGSPYVGWSLRSYVDWVLPNADWGALLQVGKAVAAGRAEPLVVLGWIEDHLPEPWSLFASPDPIEAFRALSPLPLYED